MHSRVLASKFKEGGLKNLRSFNILQTETDCRLTKEDHGGKESVEKICGWPIRALKACHVLGRLGSQSKLENLKN